MDGLMDLGYGAGQMRTHDEVKAEAPDAFRLWDSAPHLVRFLAASRCRISWPAPPAHGAGVVSGQTVVTVGHDSVNRALLLQLLDQPLSAFGKLVQDP
jgi:broad specificity phosphatase PhoE